MRSFALISLLLACGGQEPSLAGEGCVRTVQCAIGLACVAGVCSTDLLELMGDPPVGSDAGPSVDGAVDVSPADVGPGPDGGPGMDTGAVDAGNDAGPMDAGNDAGPMDAGNDAGPMDAGNDAGPDAGPMDAGNDAGPMDAGNDAGPMDGGPPDAG